MMLSFHIEIYDTVSKICPLSLDGDMEWLLLPVSKICGTSIYKVVTHSLTGLNLGIVDIAQIFWLNWWLL
jgi:hypothetical protein